MPDHFNGLSNAETERLDMLAEECAEVIQAISKIKRHGWDNRHPDGGPTNREQLFRELRDVAAVRWGMADAGDLPPDHALMQARWQQKLRYTHHQHELRAANPATVIADEAT